MAGNTFQMFEIPKLPAETTSGSKCLPIGSSSWLLSLLQLLPDEGAGLACRNRGEGGFSDVSDEQEDCNTTISLNSFKFLLLR